MHVGLTLARLSPEAVLRGHVPSELRSKTSVGNGSSVPSGSKPASSATEPSAGFRFKIQPHGWGQCHVGWSSQVHPRLRTGVTNPHRDLPHFLSAHLGQWSLPVLARGPPCSIVTRGHGMTVAQLLPGCAAHSVEPGLGSALPASN
jgi:hypothetical protein